MSSPFRSASLAAAALACVLCCVAADSPAKPTSEQIAKWVRQLGDDDFTTREAASKNLYEAGQASESALQEAAGSADAEVARRATEILDKFKWGLYPNAPQKVVEMVSRYRAADPNGKQNVITELLEAGPTGYRTLLKIAGAEEDPAVRGRLLKLVTDQLSRTAPQMLVEGNYDTLELLLDVLLANDPDQGAGHYAAYYLMRGKLDERITHFKALAGKGPDGKRSWEILAHLYHAKGDLAAARDAADKAERPELADAMLFEAGDWKELARRPVHTELGLPYESLGFQAAYRRLAGDARGSEDSLADLRKLTDAAPGDEEERFYLAKAYLLNDRPQDGLDVLVNTPGRQAAAYELLAARMDYKAAFALADKAKAANAPEAPTLEILKARTLCLLGEKDKALSIFARYGDDIKDGADFSWFQTLIEAELKVGLNDRAAEHAARVLVRPTTWACRDGCSPSCFPRTPRRPRRCGRSSTARGPTRRRSLRTRPWPP